MKRSKDVVAEIKLLQANDYDMVDETPEYVVMQKKTATLGGHVLVLLLTGWWTFGIGNLIYHIFANKKRKIIK